VSETAATDVEVSRVLNALVVTLNDHRDMAIDRGRWQAIVTGALGGEEHIEVEVDPLQHEPTARLRDAGSGQVLASVRRTGGRWLGSREGAPLTGGYVPRS
jgi:hypothetical protein